MELKNVKKLVKFTLDCEYDSEELYNTLDFLQQFESYSAVLEDLRDAINELFEGEP